MTDEAPRFRLPVVDTSASREIADGVWIIPDKDRIPFVPNIGIVVGARATLIIDSGLGSRNARIVLAEARRLSGGRPIFLTHTSCRPEHGFGANVIADEVTTLCNAAQWGELQEKGPAILRMLRDQTPPLAPLLYDVEFLGPDLRYAGCLTFDLGDGPIVELHEVGGGHSRGDQAVLVQSSSAVLFVGDLIEERRFAVVADDESRVAPWIDRLRRFQTLHPEIVVPGHGQLGGPKLISEYRGHLELARQRVAELRTAGELSEAAIVDRVTAELIQLHPDWEGVDGPRKIVASLRWPSRA